MEQLRRPQIVSIHQEALDDEYATDNKLTAVAKSSVNRRGNKSSQRR